MLHTRTRQRPQPECYAFNASEIKHSQRGMYEHFYDSVNVASVEKERIEGKNPGRRLCLTLNKTASVIFNKAKHLDLLREFWFFWTPWLKRSTFFTFVADESKYFPLCFIAQICSFYLFWILLNFTKTTRENSMKLRRLVSVCVCFCIFSPSVPLAVCEFGWFVVLQKWSQNNLSNTYKNRTHA